MDIKEKDFSMMPKFNIMVDPQGNAQEYIHEVVEAEPEVFKAYLVSEEDLELYRQGGYICVDGKPQKVELPEADPIEALTAEYEGHKAELMQAMNNAFIDGDEELMSSIREELQELKQSYKEDVENVQAKATM